MYILVRKTTGNMTALQIEQAVRLSKKTGGFFDVSGQRSTPKKYSSTLNIK
jgi:hypothetical protein